MRVFTGMNGEGYMFLFVIYFGFAGIWVGILVSEIMDFKRSGHKNPRQALSTTCSV